MRRFLAAAALIGLIALGACARASSDIDRMQPGTAITATMKDGSVISGRVVQVKPDVIVVDPSQGGEWRTLARAEIASLATEQPSTGQPSSETAQAPDAAALSKKVAGKVRARTSGVTGGREQAGQPSGGPMETRAEPALREVTIPADTLLHVKLETSVASDTSHVEDPVRASLAKGIVIDGVEAVPEGSTLTGVVTHAKPSGRVKGRAEIAFRFDVLKVSGGDEARVQTRTVALEAESTTKKDALKIGAPAAGGAIIGALLGGKKGAAIGGAVGGGAGTAVVLGTPGEEVRLTSGTAVTVKLVEPVTLRVPR